MSFREKKTPKHAASKNEEDEKVPPQRFRVKRSASQERRKAARQDRAKERRSNSAAETSGSSSHANSKDDDGSPTAPQHDMNRNITRSLSPARRLRQAITPFFTPVRGFMRKLSNPSDVEAMKQSLDDSGSSFMSPKSQKGGGGLFEDRESSTLRPVHRSFNVAEDEDLFDTTFDAFALFDEKNQINSKQKNGGKELKPLVPPSRRNLKIDDDGSNDNEEVERSDLQPPSRRNLTVNTNDHGGSMERTRQKETSTEKNSDDKRKRRSSSKKRLSSGRFQTNGGEEEEEEHGGKPASDPGKSSKGKSQSGDGEWDEPQRRPSSDPGRWAEELSSHEHERQRSGRFNFENVDENENHFDSPSKRRSVSHGKSTRPSSSKKPWSGRLISKDGEGDKSNSNTPSRRASDQQKSGRRSDSRSSARFSDPDLSSRKSTPNKLPSGKFRPESPVNIKPSSTSTSASKPPSGKFSNSQQPSSPPNKPSSNSSSLSAKPPSGRSLSKDTINLDSARPISFSRKPSSQRSFRDTKDDRRRRSRSPNKPSSVPSNMGNASREKPSSSRSFGNGTHRHKFEEAVSNPMRSSTPGHRNTGEKSIRNESPRRSNSHAKRSHLLDPTKEGQRQPNSSRSLQNKSQQGTSESEQRDRSKDRSRSKSRSKRGGRSHKGRSQTETERAEHRSRSKSREKLEKSGFLSKSSSSNNTPHKDQTDRSQSRSRSKRGGHSGDSKRRSRKESKITKQDNRSKSRERLEESGTFSKSPASERTDQSHRRGRSKSGEKSASSDALHQNQRGITRSKSRDPTTENVEQSAVEESTRRQRRGKRPSRVDVGANQEQNGIDVAVGKREAEGKDTEEIADAHRRIEVELKNVGKESLQNVKNIKDEFKQMRTQRKIAQTAEGTHSEKRFVPGKLTAESKSPLKSPTRSARALHSAKSVASMSTASELHYSTSTFQSSKAHLDTMSGFNQSLISLVDLDVGFVKSPPPALTEEQIQIEYLLKQIKKTKKLIKLTTRDVWIEREHITNYQRVNWAIRKFLMQNVGPPDSLTALNLKIEKLLRQKREIDEGEDMVVDDKESIAADCTALSEKITEAKSLFDRLQRVVVPLLPVPEKAPEEAAVKFLRTEPVSPLRSPSMTRREKEVPKCVVASTKPSKPLPRRGRGNEEDEVDENAPTDEIDIGVPTPEQIAAWASSEDESSEGSRSLGNH